MIMRNLVLTAASAVCALCAITSCNESLSTRTVESNGKFALAEGAADSLDIDIQVEYPETGLKGEALENFRKGLTANLFGEEYAEMDASGALEAYKNDRVSEYREVNLPLLEESDGMSHSVLSWSDYTYGKISGSHEGIISYTMTKYSYTGGAHGMTSVTSLNFDTRTGSLLSEADFFKEGYRSVLSDLLSRHLPGSLESPEDTSMLFVREIEPNGNFRVSEEGVTYIYNQYEIAPYVMGAIQVTVPWNELEGIYIKK